MNETKTAAPKGGQKEKVIVSGEYVLLVVDNVSEKDIETAINIIKGRSAPNEETNP